jgi:hypothetical protein
MTFIPPGIGRKVWYHAPHEAIHKDPSQPLDATICYIHNDELINVRVTDQDGHTHPRQQVKLIQEGEDPPAGDVAYCFWMPFQIDQAKRYEGKSEASGT